MPTRNTVTRAPLQADEDRTAEEAERRRKHRPGKADQQASRQFPRVREEPAVSECGGRTLEGSSAPTSGSR